VDPAALHPLMLPGRPQVLLPEQDDDPNPGDLFLGETTDRTLAALPQLPGPLGVAATPSTSPSPSPSATPSATPSASATPSQTPSASATPDATETSAGFAIHEHDPAMPSSAPPATNDAPQSTSTAPEDRISDAKLTYEQETGRTTS
jgi:hypothetical protein